MNIILVPLFAFTSDVLCDVKYISNILGEITLYSGVVYLKNTLPICGLKIDILRT